MLSETSKINLDRAVDHLLDCLSYHTCMMTTYITAPREAYEDHSERALKAALILEKLRTLIASSQEQSYYTIKPKGYTNDSH